MHVFYHSYLCSLARRDEFPQCLSSDIGVLQGHLLIVAHFYIFLTVFGSFLTTGNVIRDLLLGSVFHILLQLFALTRKSMVYVSQ